MARDQVAPTKSNLLRVKERLATAEVGYDLLEQKREILVMELMHTVERVKILERPEHPVSLRVTRKADDGSRHGASEP
jgi:vacuolar-type H+-ATPase subunit D/Vma8